MNEINQDLACVINSEDRLREHGLTDAEIAQGKERGDGFCCEKNKINFFLSKPRTVELSKQMGDTE